MNPSVIGEEPTNVSARSTELLLDIVRERTGVDFSQYRVATVERRIRNRMMMVGANTLHEYLSLVRSSPGEAHLLAERISIKVSRFYRNAVVFDCLRRHILPRLAAERGGLPVDVWVVGCGRGEEAYTIAMLLEEQRVPGVIHASDIDEGALSAASRGVYARSQLQELPRELAERFLEPMPQHGPAAYRVHDTLRERVRLHRHDLTSAAPLPGPGQFAIVSCRNVLIYLQRSAQDRALGRLRGALARDGALVLGEAEWPSGRTVKTLEVVSQKARIFRAIASGFGDVR